MGEQRKRFLSELMASEELRKRVAYATTPEEALILVEALGYTPALADIIEARTLLGEANKATIPTGLKAAKKPPAGG